MEEAAGHAERTAEGVVMELLPRALVRIRLEGEHEVIAHPAGSQRANFVRLRVGDRRLEPDNVASTSKPALLSMLMIVLG